MTRRSSGSGRRLGAVDGGLGERRRGGAAPGRERMVPRSPRKRTPACIPAALGDSVQSPSRLPLLRRTLTHFLYCPTTALLPTGAARVAPSPQPSGAFIFVLAPASYPLFPLSPSQPFVAHLPSTAHCYPARSCASSSFTCVPFSPHLRPELPLHRASPSRGATS